jgi:hypothetical protein
MIETDYWDSGEPLQLRRLNPPLARKDQTGVIGKDRI